MTMRKNRKLLLTLLGIVLTLGLLKGVQYINKSQNNSLEEISTPVQTIQTQTVSIVDQTEILSLTGNMEAYNDAIISAKIGGRVSKVLVGNGSQVSTGSVYIRDSVHDVVRTIMEGSILAVITVFIFLRNWRSTAISAVAITTSIITTFFFGMLNDFLVYGRGMPG